MGKLITSKWYGSRDGFIQHWCPGCNTRHEIAIGHANTVGAVWSITWTGEKATVHPSVKVSTNIPRNQHEINNPVTYTQCHYFIKDGMLQFLGDCIHPLAGQTVEIPDFPAL